MTALHRPSADTTGDLDVAGGRLTVNLTALVSNWRSLAAIAAPAETAAVVKANAYGTGTRPVVQALSEAGCRSFFVAHLSEAEQARAVDGRADIYVLNGLVPGAGELLAARRIIPVLGSREEIAEWQAYNRASGQALPAALHVDTGMNRLGLSLDEAESYARERQGGDAFPLALLMSHFVRAEEPEEATSAQQIARFEYIRQFFPGVRASLANSSGILLPQRPHFDLVRPGYALYGGNPTPGRPNLMRPVIELLARIVQVRAVAAGETVGYNGRWTAPAPSRIAVLSVGYADGLLRAASASNASGGGWAIVAGRECPFVGTISMDLITIDVSALPEDAVRRGHHVTLIGGALDVDRVGAHAGTIGYEVLTSLSARYKRLYAR